VARELASRLAIRRESIRRGEHAEYDSLFTPFSQQETEKLHGQLTEFYREDFLRKVAEGRKMQEDAVDAVGRGRVWSGRRALSHGLVDEIGGLSDAVQQARRLARIPERKKIRLLHYYRRRKLRELLAPDFAVGGQTQLRALSALERLEFLLQLSRHNLLLWLPYEIRIR
jgi:protease-4